MKKILFTTLLAIIATNINAQLVVDSLGRVGIGTEAPKSLPSVGGDISSNPVSTIASLKSNDKKYGTYVWNVADSEDATYGGYFCIENNTGNAYAVRGQAVGCGSTNAYQCVAGILGSAGYSYTAVGVMGRLHPHINNPINNPINFAGVYGSESGGAPSFLNYTGKYAGYFNGKVVVTNGIYATVLSPSASPSSSGQNGATILSERGESVTDKLGQVQAFQFLRYEPGRKETIVDEDEEEEVEIEPNLSPILYALDADQLKTVYPELVYEDNNGNVSINYVEMVPLLVQSINELKNEIAELKGTSPRNAKAQPTAIEEGISGIDMVRMDQNKPNPFSESTVITLNIPSSAQAANIYIYDMSGKQVQGLPVSERGETNITVYATDLSAGMYIYTLVVDGKVAVTRRMIVERK